MTSWDDFYRGITFISNIEKEHIKQTARLVSQIVRRRCALDITREEVAYRSGITQSAIARLEKGSSIPKLDIIEKVGLVLGMRLEFVLENEVKYSKLEDR